MKSSNPQKTNFNFTYVVQYTNEITQHLNADLMKGFRMRTQSVGHRQISKDVSNDKKNKQSQQITNKNKKRRAPKEIQVDLENVGRMSVRGRPMINATKEQELSQRQLIFTQKVSQVLSTPHLDHKKQIMLPSTATSKHMKTDQPYELKTSFNKKGLALISSLILQVLDSNFSEKSTFTCGEIADRVLEQFIKMSSIKPEQEQILDRQRKTIKRRVYDSINVLIALGKIKKNKKWLSIQKNQDSQAQEIILNRQKVLDGANGQLEKKEVLCKRLKIQYEKLVALRRRNEEMQQVKEVMADATVSTHTSKEHGQKEYKFPLVMVYTEKGQSLKASIDKNNISNRQTITLQAKPIYLLTELSSLQYLDMKNQRQKYLSKHEFMK